ncbi:precorrin-6A synthase (deacetylating) [Acidipropionibacterium jensenii]|uniref:precorrin-6A synthase (deacetylating) n=1 Tax=Acidipropionibacterium jensenii TaxID=1749 RepID=UPI002648E699|nr:precorrin-6A synthase (deacetylating) [Acidipropionibacterium jensenii]MDN6593085.1 precorrin-6A synthase (deacetylating) [Acidipropionibacterium jensenii]
MARELVLIGIGAGNTDWVTQAAVKAIQRLDVLFVVVKEKDLDEFVEVRRRIVAEHRDRPLRTVELHDLPRPWRSTPDYPAAVRTWRTQRLAQWGQAVAAELGEGQTGGFLVWGDPSLYESTLAIVKQLVAAAETEISVQVIPGISSVMALAAAHQIPLNRQGRAVVIEPARLLAEGMPEGTDDVVAMLDGHQTFASIDPEGLDIYWGAYLGSPDQILVHGDLATVRQEILEVRAAAVDRKGWIFDTYLIRRR